MVSSSSQFSGGQLLRFPGSRAGVTRYIHELSSIYGRQTWIDDPDFALASDPDIIAKFERDPIIYAALQMRTLSVAGQTWHLQPPTEEPVDKALASWLTELLMKIKDFSQARALLWKGGFLQGRGYSWIKGSRKNLSVDGKIHRNVWTPQRLQHQDKRSFRFVPERSEPGDDGYVRIKQNLEFWYINRRKWEPLTRDNQRALISLTYQNRADRLGYGQGIAVPLYLYFRAKGLAWRDWMTASERWGQGGMVAAQVDRAAKGTTDRTTDQIVDDWADTIDKMRSRHALVFDKDDVVQILDPSATAVQIPENIIKYCDESSTRLINGGLRPTGMNTGTGSLAQASVEQDSMDVLTQYDRAQLDEALTEHLVRAAFELNRQAIVAAGLGEGAMPRFVSSVEHKADPQESITVIGLALDKQIPLRKVDVYDALGFQAPAEGEEVFEGVQQVQAIGGGAPFDYRGRMSDHPSTHRARPFRDGVNADVGEEDYFAQRAFRRSEEEE